MNDNYLTQSISGLQEIIGLLLSVVIGLGVIWFVWSVIKYTIAEADKKEEAKQQMLWGIIGLTVIVSVWGIVAILRNFFGVEGSGDVPTGEDLLQLSAVWISSLS